jgi:hypothetical protein
MKNQLTAVLFVIAMFALSTVMLVYSVFTLFEDAVIKNFIATGEKMIAMNVAGGKFFLLFSTIAIGCNFFIIYFLRQSNLERRERRQKEREQLEELKKLVKQADSHSA